jgi:peptidoglycan hydrolase CwlO-like protein
MKKLNLDIKDYFIIVLGIALIASFLFGKNLGINYHKNEIDVLHHKNDSLLSANKTLEKLNLEIDAKISDIDSKIYENNQKLNETESQIKNLNNKKDEIPTYVNNMFANNIADAFSNYLNETTKSKSNPK